jgi:hypothetical protein
VAWWLAVGAAVIAVDRDFTDVGHVVALTLGTVVAARFGTPGHWTPLRVAFLVVGSIFGFFVVAESFGALAAPCGLAGALLAVLFTRLWTATRAGPRTDPRRRSGELLGRGFDPVR